MKDDSPQRRIDRIINDHFMFEATDDVDGVSFRLLHGKIRRENVWCDLAAIQRQLGA